MLYTLEHPIFPPICKISTHCFVHLAYRWSSHSRERNSVDSAHSKLNGWNVKTAASTKWQVHGCRACRTCSASCIYTSSSMQFPMEQNGALYSLARSYMLLHVCRREQVFTEFTVPMLLFVLRYRSKPLDTICIACWECMCDTSTLQKASRWTELARESEGCKLGYARSNSSNGHLLSYKDPPRAARFALLAFRTKLIWFILCICVLLEDVVHHHTPPSHTANTHIIWMRTYISKKSWARWERYDECNINRQKIIPDGPLICTHPHHTCTQPRQWDLLLRPWALYILCWESSKRVVFLFTLHQMDVYL